MKQIQIRVRQGKKLTALLAPLIAAGSLYGQDMGYAKKYLEMDQTLVVVANELYQTGCLSQTELSGSVTLEPRTLLQKAVCKFYAMAPASVEKDLYRRNLKEVLNLLARVQTSGIADGGRNYAIFLGGIVGCRLARAAQTYNLLDPYFCPARASSLESFQAVAWDRFQVIYTGSDGQENPSPLSNLYREMTSCYEDILSADGNYDASCGVTANADNLEKITDEKTKKVFAAMFTDASSPIDAIIQRKKKLTERVLEHARDQLWGGGDRPNDNSLMPASSLGGKAFVVQSNHAKLNDAKELLDRRVTDLKKRYETASRAATLIIEEYQRLSDGMYEDENHKNWKNDIADAAGAMGDQLRVAQQKNDSALPSNWDRIKNLPVLIGEMFQYAKNRKPTIDQLCRVYFCELAQSQHLETGRGAMTKGCMDSSTRGNPLCTKVGAQVSDIAMRVEGATDPINIADLCQTAGFGVPGGESANYLKIGMSAKDRDNCFAGR